MRRILSAPFAAAFSTLMLVAYLVLIALTGLYILSLGALVLASVVVIFPLAVVGDRLQGRPPLTSATAVVDQLRQRVAARSDQS